MVELVKITLKIKLYWNIEAFSSFFVSAPPYSRALRRRHCVGGGAPQGQKICGGGGAARAVKFSNFTFFFQVLSAKNFCYKSMHVQPLYLAVVWPQLDKNIIKTGFQ